MTTSNEYFLEAHVPDTQLYMYAYKYIDIYSPEIRCLTSFLFVVFLPKCRCMINSYQTEVLIAWQNSMIVKAKTAYDIVVKYIIELRKNVSDKTNIII